VLAVSGRHAAECRLDAPLLDTLRPFGSGAYLLNFLDQEEDSVVRAAFGGNHSRLVQMKNKYDPTNLFRLNQNIKPSA
jgi:hypothetical protein